MPIRDHKSKDGGICSCCGTKTLTTTGFVTLEDNSEFLYLARWTPGCPTSGIAFLIGMGHPDGFVSVLYRFDHNAFMVVGPEGYDWRSNVSILPRERVIGTALASLVFRALDEIWEHDPELIQFIESTSRFE